MDWDMATKSRRIAHTALLGLLLAACCALLPASASAAPMLTMEAPLASATTGATPTFSGATDDPTDTVEVKIYEGESTSGTLLRTLPATPSGDSWTVQVPALEGLPAGTYTAVAEQTQLGETSNSEPPVTFTVSTEKPTVTIAQPKSPSNKTEPTFSGTASEDTEVVVHVFEGTTEVATASTTASGGEWSTSGLSEALPTGKHTFTAYATEVSGIGNEEGESGTVAFEVNTAKPAVTIAQPLTPSNKTEPSFSGTASEATEVVVHVFEGTKEVATATTTAAGGKWSTSGLSKALSTGKHTFTAQATEVSGLGNEEGESGTVAFEVNTEKPVVTIAQPLTPSNKTEPAFSGTASEATEVVVHVFEGATEVATAKTTASGGKWSTSGLSKALSTGTFTAVAKEKSGLGNAEGESAKVTFEVNTTAPTVTIVQPATPSNKTEPSFSGTASEATEVVVHVFEGATEVATASTTASGGKWSTSGLSKALSTGKRTFTAYATEVSGLGNEEGESGTVTFEVDTEKPVVTLAQPLTPSNKAEPSFSGTASEATEVVVHVFEGTTEVATAKATASGGKWSTAALTKALTSSRGTFTAVAKEKSGLGNAEGESAKVTFEINTEKPVVTIAQPTTPSNKTEPSFSGTASEDTEVVVHVFEGLTEVATASTTAAGGKWSTSGLSKALLTGKHIYTAQATEVSGLGNEEGESGTVSFEVNTTAPTVTIVQPVTPSNKTEPSFSGTASEATEVVVHVFEGPTEVATATTTAAGGKWSTSGLSKALPTGKRTFTAHATEVSGLGNEEGESGTVSFEVNTTAPTVTIAQPVTPSNKTEPAFSGTASEATEVVVHVFEGATEVATAKATASGGKWSTSTLSKALTTGTFTAVAKEKSGLGNAEGESAKVTFEINTEKPVVTIAQPITPSNKTEPSFSGTASEATEVVVHVFEGATEVATAKATASGGKWSTSGLSKALSTGKHTFTAHATEVSGLGNEEGESGTVSFEVNTTAPTVTIAQPLTPSNKTEPSFSGTASEATEVVVHVFEGVTEVATASTTASGGKWSTSGLSKALPAGKRTFTAQATEVSGLGNGEGESGTVTFEVNTEKPVVTIAQPITPSNKTEPAFSGTASEATEVVVHVFEGATEVASATTTASGGKWSTSGLSKALTTGTFTAVAKEKSGLGNGEGESAKVTFEVNTEPPVVTIVQPATPSNKTEPSFSGTASEATEVVVHVFEGTTEVATAKATASGGKWSTSTLSKALTTGTFTAIAKEKSGLGNAEGESAKVTFEVNTEPPVVTIVQPATPSNKIMPGFSGTASEATEVEVHVFLGAEEVANVKTTAAGGKWSTSTLSKALPEGKHTFTAYAKEKSGLGNGEGESAKVTFEVNTEPPVVTIAQPATPSNKIMPGFSGTASEATEVVVHVFEGSTEVASATTTAAGGKWSTSTLSKALPEGKHTFTAYAKEKSGLGNGEGESGKVTFEVNTEPPVVTLAQPVTPSNKTEPSFSGTASEATEVVVHVFEGATEVATAKATASGGKWSTSTLSKALTTGTFTAVAKEKSGLGNAEGESAKVTFEVNTEPPVVTIVQPATPSNKIMPGFSGTASEATEVVVHVFEGSTEVASATTTAAGGKWSTSTLSKALPEGKHTFTAYAKEKSGLGNGEGESSKVTFEVNTEPPVVTIAQPTTPSNKITPGFSGTASEATEVVVHVFEGASEVATTTTTAVGGKWSTSTLSKALPEGKHTFTAYAKEKSGLGNGEGESSKVTFEVNTEPPVVTIAQPTTPSNKITPGFSGTASEATEVEVHVFLGTEEVANVKTTAAGGKWSTSTLSKALPEGKHTFTAVAKEKSGLGNKEGESSKVTFEVNTEPPVVTMAQPTTPSNKIMPGFAGTASEATEVVVHVFEGSTEVANVKTTASGGTWSTSTLSKALPEGKHTFTAYAKEKSGLGNKEGESAKVTFEVNTEPPVVTLAQPTTPSNKITPPFSGTASEATEVEVHVFEGATEVANVSTTASGGAWSTSTLSKALPEGKHTFTAYATEKSGLGNGEGKSTPSVTFEVNTLPPVVTLAQPTTPSNKTTPPFSGTASEETEVEVHVFLGTEEVANVKTTAVGGKWSTSTLSKALPEGKHVFTAYATGEERPWQRRRQEHPGGIVRSQHRTAGRDPRAARRSVEQQDAGVHGRGERSGVGHRRSLQGWQG